jgi:hypothetical protein
MSRDIELVELMELFSRSSMRTFLADLDETLHNLSPVQRSPIVKPPHQAVQRLGPAGVAELVSAPTS